jgi:DNA-binding CsgD family transcriptional regulator
MQKGNTVSQDNKQPVETLRITQTQRRVEHLARAGTLRRLGNRASTQLHPATIAERPIEAESAVLPLENGIIDDCNQLIDEVCSVLRHTEIRLISFAGESAETRSRLAEHVAATLEPELKYRVVLVDLGRTRQQSAIAQALAEALRGGSTAAMSLLNELVAWMQGKPIVLIVDNVARLKERGRSVADLLERCPQLRVLLTSPLGVQLEGQQDFVLRLPRTEAHDKPERSAPAATTRPPIQPVKGGRPLVRELDSGGTLQPGLAPGETELPPLTTREQEVAQLLALGFSNREIAKQLVITYRTAETHACRVMQKLGFHCRSLVVQWAIECGLVVVACSSS